MAISYFWTINPLEAYPTASGENDVVFTAHWQLHATYTPTSGSTYKAQSIGSQGLTYQSGSAFTPFNDLTLPQVQGWVENALGEGRVNSMKTALSQSINDQVTPPSVVLASPWITGSI
jgi:hypothetical protein